MEFKAGPHGILLTGTAGQIRSCLKKMAVHPLTVKQYLEKCHPQHPYLVKMK
ncbi:MULTISPECIES: Z-ring formation inhibitor MciZ [Thermoactinomyces]|jgi:hypothetical protein|uniref:Z-ring formation inhibitor MciZ n=1 Tax=Thermoactinomyces TaxID=2023 RepID=UPI000AD3E568|nr:MULTISPECIES: Z-ring formation inhibitor MciZ [Thermoactinomyces]MBI0386216.1 Z-ring formation inhibitor MciZ [Thermoactinomyces sp. CICC 24227]QCV55702.1 Z-ring formation inhibitor MciZ [Thermoactinomyces vulgaris]